MKDYFTKKWEQFIIWGYVRYGLIDGDLSSYCYSDKGIERKFKWFEKRYVKLGYKPLTYWEWQDAGGYGIRFKHLLRVKV